MSILIHNFEETIQFILEHKTIVKDKALDMWLHDTQKQLACMQIFFLNKAGAQIKSLSSSSHSKIERDCVNIHNYCFKKI